MVNISILIYIIYRSICIIFSCIFYQAAARSGCTPKIFRVIYRRALTKNNYEETNTLFQTSSLENEKLKTPIKTLKSPKTTGSTKKTN